MLPLSGAISHHIVFILLYAVMHIINKYNNHHAIEILVYNDYYIVYLSTHLGTNLLFKIFIPTTTLRASVCIWN